MRASKMLNLYKPDSLRQSAQSEVQKQEKKDNCTESYVLWLDGWLNVSDFDDFDAPVFKVTFFTHNITSSYVWILCKQKKVRGNISH